MGRRARFRGAKATPKTVERDLLDKSKSLAEDPSLLMPSCEQQCGRCPFRKAVSKMEKVSTLRYNQKKLEHAMNWGDPLVRAYAATISLHLAGKVPYLATSRTPIGEISYAVRGKTERDKLIGVQHYDHPQLRLLALWRIAEKRDLHLYSLEDKVVCSPDGPRPPEEYVHEAISGLPYDLDDEHRCPHRDAAQLLVIKWRGAGATLGICSACARDVNTVHQLVSRIAARDPTDDFEVEVSDAVRCSSSCPHCGVREASRLSKGLLGSYMKGEIDDATLLQRQAQERLSAIREKESEVYIVGNECFGKDKERFLAALRGNEAEKEAIAGLIGSRKMCVISRTDQAANLISDLWPEHRTALLSQVASPEVVSAVERDKGELTPAQLVTEAKRLERAKGIEATLPAYRRLGNVGRFADQLARTYKTEGREAVLRQVDRSKASDHKLRSVSYAFLSALGEGQARAWQFTREEIDYGAYLADFAQRLLEAKGGEYHEALKLLIQASGSLEEAELA